MYLLFSAWVSIFFYLWELGFSNGLTVRHNFLGWLFLRPDPVLEPLELLPPLGLLWLVPGITLPKGCRASGEVPLLLWCPLVSPLGTETCPRAETEVAFPFLWWASLIVATPLLLLLWPLVLLVNPAIFKSSAALSTPDSSWYLEFVKKKSLKNIHLKDYSNFFREIEKSYIFRYINFAFVDVIQKILELPRTTFIRDNTNEILIRWSTTRWNFDVQNLIFEIGRCSTKNHFMSGEMLSLNNNIDVYQLPRLKQKKMSFFLLNVEIQT